MLRARPSYRAASLLAGLGLVRPGCAATSDTESARTPAETTSATASVDLSSFGHLPPVPDQDSPSVQCSYATDGRAARKVSLPDGDNVATAGTHRIAVETDRGRIGLTLDRAEAPCTVNSFLSLVSQRYFDQTSCHRLSTTNLRILQCGDPTGTGLGGPGYTFPNEYPTTTYAVTNSAAQLPVVYPRGTVAMANTGTPGTNGSQFFLVYADSPLPPLFTVFGKIDAAGLRTVEKVAAAGHDGTTEAGGGKPNLPVQIRRASAAG